MPAWTLRMAMTTVTIVAVGWLVLRADVLPRDGWGALLRTLVMWVGGVHALALLWAAPRFELRQYVANVAVALVAVPAAVALLTRGCLVDTCDVGIAFRLLAMYASGPTLLALLLTTAGWAVFRRQRGAAT